MKFIQTLVEQAGWTKEGAEKTFASLAGKGWSADELQLFANAEIKSFDGTYDRMDAEIADFEWRAIPARQGGH